MSDTNETDKTNLEDEIEFKEAKLTSSEKKKLKKQKRSLVKRGKTEHGYVYLGHIPHGFFETEIKSYFSQFGRVVKLRLARSLKTGVHKGYGFVEFENVEVARIAAETMNNYLMFNKILKCHLIPKEKLHKLTFKNAKKPFHMRLSSKMRQRFNAKKSVEKLEKIEKRNKTKMTNRQKKFKELGINLDLSKLLNKEVAKETTEAKASSLSKIETVASEKNKKTEDAVTIKAKKLKSKK